MQDAMKKVDIEMKRSDELLSQMIPKAVADKVKKGLNPVDSCEVLILFMHKILRKGIIKYQNGFYTLFSFFRFIKGV